MSYRAFLTWVSSVSAFVSSKLITPLGQFAFFLALGSQVADRPRSFFVVGNAFVLSSYGALFGVAITTYRSRIAGVLLYLATVPIKRVRLTIMLALINAFDGLLTGGFLLAGGFAIFGLPLAFFWPTLLAMVVSATSAAALGMCIGQLELRVRTSQGLLMTLVFTLTLLFSGSNVAPNDLPVVLHQIAVVWPMSQGIEAGRLAAAGGALPADLLAVEALKAVFVGAVALLAASFFEHQSYRKGAVDTWS